MATNTETTDKELAQTLHRAIELDHIAIRGDGLALPKPSEFPETLPIKLTDEARENIQNARKRVEQIIDGEDDARLLIVGPCSPDFNSIEDGKIPAVVAFARKLKNTIEELEAKHKVLVIVRTPAVKPRTAVGWGGIFTDSPSATRMLFTILANEGVRLATEVYGQFQQDFLSDLCVLTWVGARNVTAPNTRTQVAESICPVLVKHGLVDLESSINARSVIANAQAASRVDWETGKLTIKKTHGNRHTLTILRGYEINGKHTPNIDAETVLEATELALKADLPAGVVIDVSHSNGLKSVEGSLAAFDKVMELLENPETAPYVRGVMIESYLSGKGEGYGESLTDPTIDIETTKKLMKRFAEACRKNDK